MLGVLAALGALCFIFSLFGFLYLFRVRKETPVGESEAKRRLEAVWAGPAPQKFETVQILHHHKEMIWDGTTHETWIAFIPEDLKPKLDATASPFLRIDNPTAWPLPEAATTAGYKALQPAVYLAEGGKSSSGAEHPTRIRAVLWPVAAGHIAHYEFTVID
ncbi:MAG: hypothetical protein H7067_11155 [Burkholderiales bacterium]|nr:hypothetical protein [Opitutaceae bacterium]